MIEPIGCGFQRALHDRPDLWRQSAAHHQHAIVIDPDLEMPALVTSPVVVSRGDSVDVSPGAHQPFDVCRCCAVGKVEQPFFGLGRCHPGQGAYLRVGQPTATHCIAQLWQIGKGACHAHLLASRTHGEACAPIQPVRAGLEAAAPPSTFIELADHDQQLVGRRLDARCQLGDGIAKDCGLGLASQAGSLVGQVRRGPFIMIIMSHNR